MKFTDPKAIQLLKKVCFQMLEDDIKEYPEEERWGRTDMEMLADEAGYLYSLHFNDGCELYYDLAEAREKLRITKYGKVTEMYEMYGYSEYDIQVAKDFVNDFNRLGRLVKKLEKMGYYSEWIYRMRMD